MNGRVYEPVAGRFLGVDPIVNIGNGQSPNSYTYVWNNPLTMIDPSGFDGEDVVTEGDSQPRNFPQCPYEIANIAVDCPYQYGWRWSDINWIDRWLIDEWRVQMWVNSMDARTQPQAQAQSGAPQIAMSDGQSFGGPVVMFGARGGFLESFIAKVIKKAALDSGFEEELFDQYWFGRGDLEITQAEFEHIVAVARDAPVLESYEIGSPDGTYFAHKFDFYGITRYDKGLGSAWIIFDSKGSAVGLFDNYDFNAKDWGVRTTGSELQTRALGNLGRIVGAKPYRVYYGRYFDLP